MRMAVDDAGLWSIYQTFFFYASSLLLAVLIFLIFTFAQASLSTTPCIRSSWPATANKTSPLTLTTLCAA